MEAGNSRSTMRKRLSKQPKFGVNERVEVWSMDPGFLGSWHPGTVIRCGKLKRDVRYDNLLNDDGVGHLVEKVTVSKALDGGNSDSSEPNLRGLIRPIPPPIEFEGSELKYGVCVDVNHEEAWWEGVIFDRCDGTEERSVFFPDLGDEMKVGAHQMRITYDWNEVTGKWRRRGKWVFLELIEECEAKTFVAVSIMQIWYDIRTKKDFDKIKDWTCNVKDLWRGMVEEVVNYYYDIIVTELAKHFEKEIQEDLGEEEEEEDLKEEELESVEQPMVYDVDFNKQENGGMRVPKPPARVQDGRVAFRPPPIRPAYPRPMAVTPPFFRPTNATATPILHPPVPPPPPPITSATRVASAGSSPPPSVAIAGETAEVTGRASKLFPEFMRFMPTPGYKAPKKTGQ